MLGELDWSQPSVERQPGTIALNGKRRVADSECAPGMIAPGRKRNVVKIVPRVR